MKLAGDSRSVEPVAVHQGSGVRARPRIHIHALQKRGRVFVLPNSFARGGFEGQYHFVIAIAIHRVEPVAIHGDARAADRQWMFPGTTRSARRPHRPNGPAWHLKSPVWTCPLSPFGSCREHNLANTPPDNHRAADYEPLAYHWRHPPAPRR